MIHLISLAQVLCQISFLTTGIQTQTSRMVGIFITVTLGSKAKPNHKCTTTAQTKSWGRTMLWRLAPSPHIKKVGKRITAKR